MTFMKGLDVIFCCNVLIYFDLVSKRRVIQHFYNNLLPHGYLFLGHSESLFGVSEEFRLVHLPGATAYIKGERTGGKVGGYMNTAAIKAACSIAIEDLQQIPTIPAVLAPLLRYLEQPVEQLDVQKVTDMIAQDKSLAAQCLQMANSPSIRALAESRLFARSHHRPRISPR